MNDITEEEVEYYESLIDELLGSKVLSDKRAIRTIIAVLRHKLQLLHIKEGK